MPNDQPLVVACSACSSLPPPAVATIPHRAISTIARHSEFGGYKNRRHNAHTPHTRCVSERATDRRRVLRDLKPEIRAGNPGEQLCVREPKLARLSQAGQRSRGAPAHAARRVGSDQIRSVGEILQSEQGGGSTCCTSERASERASTRPALRFERCLLPYSTLSA